MPPKKLGVIDLGDLAAETRPVKIKRDGQEIVLKGYVDGRRCPGYVKVAVFAANDNLRKLGSSEDAIPSQLENAWYEGIRDTLLAVIEGLEFSEAEVLASDTDMVDVLLKYLGWRAEETEQDDNPPPQEIQSIGEESSQSLVPLTT